MLGDDVGIKECQQFGLCQSRTAVSSSGRAFAALRSQNRRPGSPHGRSGAIVDNDDSVPCQPGEQSVDPGLIVAHGDHDGDVGFGRTEHRPRVPHSGVEQFAGEL